MQKNLPRPIVINERVYASIYENEEIPLLRREVEKLISEEMVHILGLDSIKHPFAHAKVCIFLWFFIGNN